MQKIILFDLDGTVANTAPGIKRCIKYALSQINFRELSDAELNDFIGPPIFDAFENAGVPDSLSAEVIEIYRQAYAEGVCGEEPYMFDVSPYPGIGELMKQVFDQGYTVITGTSKPEPWARQIIERFGFLDYLTPFQHFTGEYVINGEPAGKFVNDGVFGASMDASRVHKSQVLEYALASAGFDKATDKAILLGDRDHDINGAKAIGIPVVGCTWGYAVPGELDGADVKIDHPSEFDKKASFLLN